MLADGQVLPAEARRWQDLAERIGAAWRAGHFDDAGELFLQLQSLSTPWLLAIAHRKGAASAADELVAQAHLALLEKIEGGEPIDNVKGLLCTILRRRVVDWHRRRGGMEVDTKDDRFWEHLAASTTPFDSGPDRIADAEEREAVQRVANTILDALPAEEREVLLARDLEELGVAETARQLGLTEDQVKKRRQRAIESARRIVEERGLRHDIG